MCLTTQELVLYSSMTAVGQGDITSLVKERAEVTVSVHLHIDFDIFDMLVRMTKKEQCCSKPHLS